MTQLNHADFLVEPGRTVCLTDFDPASMGDFKTKYHGREKLRADIARLAELRDVFLMQEHYALLIIFQRVDGAIDPRGAVDGTRGDPGRWTRKLPPRGKIAILNNSYYDELAVARIYPAVPAREELAPEPPTGGTSWKDRCAAITSFERRLTRNGTRILKFFFHVSDEVLRRDRYRHAYEELLTLTGADAAPWYIIPADHDWFSQAAAASIIVAELESLDPKYPPDRVDLNDPLSEPTATLPIAAPTGQMQRPKPSRPFPFPAPVRNCRARKMFSYPCRK